MIEITKEALEAAREIGLIRGLLNVLPQHAFTWLYKRYKDQLLQLDNDGWCILLSMDYSGGNFLEKFFILQNTRIWDWDLVWTIASIISELECLKTFTNINISTPELMYEIIEFKTRAHLTALTYVPKAWYKCSRWSKRRLKAIQLCGLEEEITELALQNFYTSSGQKDKVRDDSYRWTTPGEILKIKREKDRLIKHFNGGGK